MSTIQEKIAAMIHHAKEITTAVTELQGEQAANAFVEPIKLNVKEMVVKYDLDMDEILADAATLVTMPDPTLGALACN